MRTKIRVPAGTVIVFPPCPVSDAILPESAVKLNEEALPKEPCADPRPKTMAAQTIIVRMSFLSFVDSRLFLDNRQRRSDLKINDQKQLVFDLKEARRGNGAHRLLHDLIVFCQQLAPLLLIVEAALNQFVGLRVRHLRVIPRIVLDIF